MKHFVAILLILVLVFALSATAFAASNVTSPHKGNTNRMSIPIPARPLRRPVNPSSIQCPRVILAAVAAVGVVLHFCGKKLVCAK